jgi:hypothetical protein
MAHGRPWYKRNGADFVMATLSFPSSDHKWAYSAIVDILNERDRPIADDPGFICGFTGLSKRRWTPVRQWLLDHAYLQLTPGGELTNPRFEREHAERLAERDAAVQHGREGGRKSAAQRAADRQPELEFISRSSRDKPEIISGKTEDKFGERPPTSPENKDLAQPPPQASRGRERASEAREESIQTIDHNNARESGDPPDGRSVGPPPDLLALLDLVSEASGYNPVQPGEIAKAVDQVKAWRDDGLDFDTVVLPTIRHVIAHSNDPTSSLKRFDKRVRHEAAKHRGAKANGTTPPPPPAVPVLDPPGEDSTVRPIREAMLAQLGPRLFSLLLNEVTFEPAQQGDRKPLIVHGPSYMVERIVHGDNSRAILATARQHGFTDLWKGAR